MLDENQTKVSTIVIGAGPAGLAVMKELKCNGLPYLGLESHDAVGGMWNIQNPQSPTYIGLKTNSSKTTTYLDTTAPGDWPSYFSHSRALQDYATRHQLISKIHFNSRVEKVEKTDSGWEVTVAAQDSIQSVQAYRLVVCTGVHNRDNQRIPHELSDRFIRSGIDALHSSQYKNPLPYSNKRVLLVGFGNSAADIATEISAVAKKTIVSSRTVPWIIPLWVLGVPADQFRGFASKAHTPFALQNFIFHCLQRIYIGHPRQLGLGEVQHDLLDLLPVSDRGLVKAIKQKDVHLYGSINRVKGNRVYFDSKQDKFEDVDKVIFATGYHRHHPFLDRDYVQPLLNKEIVFPLFIFHPIERELFFTSEVNVPQGSWPLFTKQAKAIVSYCKAEDSPLENFHRFNRARHQINPDLKGKIFSRADRYHVDPDVYAKQIDRFCDWIRL